MRTISSDIDSYLYFLQIGNALWIGEDGLGLLVSDPEDVGEGTSPDVDAEPPPSG